VIPVIVKEFGFLEDKKEKAAKKEKAIVVANPKNAGIVAAFQELGEFYFKEGNKNAGGTYAKATNAIMGLKLEITEENAKSLGKPGKNKVDGIGAKTAEKMLEYVQTGTMEKLEEKRADAA
jgi:DNA polymerase/3'-5' exonuclease PolX